MPISEKMVEFDPRAYVISKKFDERVEQYKENRKYSLNKGNKNLKDLLASCYGINEIINGFEHPPIEIIEELTDEGKSELFQYYHEKKQELLSTYCDNLILSYEAIRVGYELNDLIFSSQNNVLKKQDLSIKLSGYGRSFALITETKHQAKEMLLRATRLLASERKFLFEVFIKEIDAKITTNLINLFIDKIMSLYIKNIDLFCESNFISKNSRKYNLEQKIKLANRLFSTKNYYIDIAQKNASEYAEIIIEKIIEKNVDLEQKFATQGIDNQVLEEIHKYVDKVESTIFAAKDSDEMKELGKKFIMSYDGLFQTEMTEFINNVVIGALNGRSLTQKFRDKFLNMKDSKDAY